jgi:DNA helicase-2/ATP-dependent DNA helicase PcrA
MDNLARKDESFGYMRDLNLPQTEAVMELETHVLVLAGAGTGKTRVLTTRIAHILSEKRAKSHEIIALTFTNKAATEMKGRIAKVLQGSIDLFWMGTFHSVCAKILRRHAEILGYTPTFTILDMDDQQRLIKQIMKEENISSQDISPVYASISISRWKDKGWLPERVSSLGFHEREMEVLRVYKIYQKRLKNFNSLDFGDLLLLCLNLFLEHPDVLKKYHEQFKFILIDEYQDTNVAQYLWLKLLSQGGANVCCVGDDDQSIYGWRGAEVENILRFEKDFKGARVVRLEQNYRSTHEILNAASGLISHNSHRFEKTLWTQGKEGEKISVRGLWDSRDEARYIGDEIENLQRTKISLNDMAILVRAGYQTREFEERFMILGIPYRVIGGPRFYERMEIRDALAYLRVVVEPHDSLAYERILNTPKRGIGITTLQLLHLYSRNQECSLFDATNALVETEDLRGGVRKTLQEFNTQLKFWGSLLQDSKHTEVAARILEESGYMRMWELDHTPEAAGRIENLKEMIRAIDSFESLPAFLEHVSLVMENVSDRESDMITVMTLHSAKGLEFDTVFLAGWDEGIFPHAKSLQESGEQGLEEERRLAYVGLTRAKRKVYITYASYRRIFGTTESSIPSRFIEELPKESIERFAERGIVHTNMSKPFVLASYEKSAVIQSEKFEISDRIFHVKFGYGSIISIEGDKADIEFDKAGPKKVVTSFLEKITKN